MTIIEFFKAHRGVMRFFVINLCMVLLVACGKKPADVDPPRGASKIEKSTVYPDPALDPKP